MRRGLGSNGSFGRQRVALLGTVVLMAGLAAGPGMMAARSAAPAGTIERVSVPDGAGRRRPQRPPRQRQLAGLLGAQLPALHEAHPER